MRLTPRNIINLFKMADRAFTFTSILGLISNLFACFQANLALLFLQADYSRRQQNFIRSLALPVSSGARSDLVVARQQRARPFWVRPVRTSAWWGNFLAQTVIVKANTRASGMRSLGIVKKLSFLNRFIVYVTCGRMVFLKMEKKRIRIRVDVTEPSNDVVQLFKVFLFFSVNFPLVRNDVISSLAIITKPKYLALGGLFLPPLEKSNTRVDNFETTILWCKRVVG